jgi:hypothetical protein
MEVKLEFCAVRSMRHQILILEVDWPPRSVKRASPGGAACESNN